MRISLLGLVVLSSIGAAPVGAISIPEVQQVARCQRSIAAAGAKFAMKNIRAVLKCTNGVADCQIQCDYGVFGPSCNDGPPPCCDSDDPGSNSAFGACMAKADEVCIDQDEAIANYELTKQSKITNSCSSLSTEQLCGANGEGLNFGLLAAGCQALDPNWVCGLPGILSCVGGPLQQKLADQVSTLLDPRAPEAVTALGIQSRFDGIPGTRKVKEDVPAGMADVFAITGRAGDEFVVRVKTADDSGTGASTLRPVLTLLNTDMASPVANTDIRQVPCAVPNACGTTCPMFRRVLPYDGTFFIAVAGGGGGGCTGGAYKLVVTSPSSAVPALVADDVNP